MSEELAAQLQSIFPDEPDQAPIYLGNTHGAVLAALRRDLGAGRRFICLVGPAGSGKTKLLQALRAEFEQGLVGMAVAPRDDAFLFSLMKGLGLQVPDRNEVAARQRLAVVLGMAERKHTPVLQIVDAAERLGRDDLSTLFQLFGPSFTQVVLSGRPELLDLLADGQRPLGIPRPDAVHRLEGLGATETGAYISHRLRQAQLPEDLFASEASAALHARSGGVPRVINAISREALRQAEAAGGDRVGQAEVQRTAKAELPAAKQTKAPDTAGTSQTDHAKAASPKPEAAPAGSEPSAKPPGQQTAASEQAPRGSSSPAEPVSAQRPEPAQESSRQEADLPQRMVPPRESAMPPAMAPNAMSRHEPSVPQPVAHPSSPGDQSSLASEPPIKQDTRGSDLQRERPPSPQALPSSAPKSPPEPAMRATRQVPAQPPKPDAQAPQKPQASEPQTRADRSESTQTPVKAPTQTPARAPQAAKVSSPKPMSTPSGPASSGRGTEQVGSVTQRRPRESLQPTRTQAGVGAAAVKKPTVAAALAHRTGARRNYLRPALIAAAALAAIAVGIDGYRGADRPSATIAEGSAGPDAAGAAAPTNVPDRPAEPPTANVAGTRGPDASGADGQPSSTPPSAMTTAPAETTPGETPADAAVDFAQLSSNETFPAEKPPNPRPDGGGLDAKDARPEVDDAAQAPAPGGADQEPDEPPPATATVRPPASSPPGAAEPAPRLASAAPEAASASKPAPEEPAAAAAPKPKATSAAKRPAPSAVGKPTTPLPAELARLYAVRADYELNRGKPREALISVAHGLAAVPDDRALQRLRARALERLRVRVAQ